MKKTRTIAKIVKGNPSIDGAGVSLTRVISKPDINDFDPFLMLDSFDSINPQDYLKGFPWHPHRGIETLTYLIQGEIEHQDSLGHKGLIKDNQAQWMSAASGILHQEMPQATQRLLGFQLWINMPTKQKMTNPKYNDLKLGQGINSYQDQNIEVDVIAGSYKNIQGFNPEYVKATVLIIKLQPDTNFEYDVSKENTVFIYTLENTITLNDELISEKSAVLLKDGTNITFKSNDKKAIIALFSAKPLHQPIAWGGPIVMSTTAELNQAFKDLENNNFIKE